MKGFRQIEFKRGGLTIQCGGHLKKPFPLTTKEVRAPGSGPEIEPATYVLIRAARDHWLNHMVVGKCYGRTPINSGFLREIRAAVANMARRIRSGLPAELPAMDLPTGADTMNEIVGNNPEPRKTPKKKRRFVSQECQIRMPEWPEEAREGRPKIMRDVSVYIEGVKPIDWQPIWIHTKDLVWLVHSLLIYQKLGRVADVGSDDAGTEAPKSMEPDLTPEKCPRPQEAAGNFYDKWAAAP